MNLRKKGTGLFLAFLLNTVIANLVESASKVEDFLEDIEDTLLDNKSDQSDVGQQIQVRRKDYLLIKKNSQPLREQFSKLLRTDTIIISKDIRPIYNDLADQLQFVMQTLESCRETISALVELYISKNDMAMIDIIKRLTVV